MHTPHSKRLPWLGRRRFVGILGFRRRWRHSQPFTCEVWRLVPTEARP